jgi:hypothetical protein
MAGAGDYAYLWAWEPLCPSEVGRLLSGLRCPWWICGGWALDLFLNSQTRRHDDLDVAVLRRDQADLYRYLRDWDLRYATPGHTLERWHGERLELPIHGIWAGRCRDNRWTCEFLLSEERDGAWVYGRNSAVTLRLDQLGAEQDGIPFFRPEVVLLYKSSEPSPKNDTDFATVRPHLSAAGQEWLRRALAVCDRRHPWLPRLSQG